MKIYVAYTASKKIFFLNAIKRSFSVHSLFIQVRVFHSYVINYSLKKRIFKNLTTIFSTYLQVFVQTVRIPVLEFSIAPIPGRGFGLLHPWKPEIATFRYRTLERGPKTVQHPAGLVLSEDVAISSTNPSLFFERARPSAPPSRKYYDGNITIRSIHKKTIIDRGHVK